MGSMTIFAATSLVAAVIAASPAADWPQFRGPTGQAISSAQNVPLEWTATENVAWKAPVAGNGWSSPVLHNGRLYLTSAVPVDETSGDLSLRAICLDARRGTVVWDVEVFTEVASQAPSIHKKNSHASPTPLVADDRVYVHFGHQGIACLDLDGAVLWRNASLKYNPVHGNGGSPVLADGALVFSCDGAERPFVAAVNCRDGSPRWVVERDVEVAKTFSFSTPLAVEITGRQQVITPGSNVVSALDPRDGREFWRVRYEGYSVIPRPVLAHGLIYISTGYDSPELLAIRPDGAGDVTDTHVVWRTKKGAPNTPSVLVVGDELYMVSDRGVASCLDARSGELHWQERIGGNFSASPVYAEGRIYLQDEEGNTTVIEAGKEYVELARNSIGEPTLASPAMADDVIYLRGDAHLYAIGAP